MTKLEIPPIDGKHADFARRFREALVFAGLLIYDVEKNEKIGSYEAAAKELGCSRTYVGDMYRGVKFPSGSRGSKLATRLKVSANWFLNGVPPMVSDRLIDIAALLPEDQIDMLTRLRAAEKRAAEAKEKK